MIKDLFSALVGASVIAIPLMYDFVMRG